MFHQWEFIPSEGNKMGKGLVLGAGILAASGVPANDGNGLKKCLKSAKGDEAKADCHYVHRRFEDYAPGRTGRREPTRDQNGQKVHDWCAGCCTQKCREKKWTRRMEWIKKGQVARQKIKEQKEREKELQRNQEDLALWLGVSAGYGLFAKEVVLRESKRRKGKRPQSPGRRRRARKKVNKMARKPRKPHRRTPSVGRKKK